MSASIFISFASKDVKVATTLCSALESRGFACWISARDIQPGENFQVSIVQALRRAKIMLLVFTANSNTSEEMTKELALASQQKLIVIPLRIEDVTPNDAFAYEFATRQWIDVFSDWESSIDQLCRRIGRALEGHPVEAPSQAAAPAPVIAPVITPSKPRVAKAAPVEEPEVESEPEEAFDPYSTSLPVLANDDTEAEVEYEDAEEEADDEHQAPARRSPGLWRAALLAAGVAALAVIGLATPKLLGGKHAPTAQVAAAPPPVAAPVQAVAAAPVLLAAQAVLVEDEKPVARPKRKAVSRDREVAAKKDQSNDIPF
ncbi:toll/interleukin-1 receptor domain-containing protein [Phenylobacterium sp.]|uniref:toll/interleukin-1 receptor domain-containing protein n=1 Tax=Phenylobacterium sp. TaxID=1871053 RepID=UPI002736364C|nr:toll/interleukin-1 receptor domain-containing protein [Phenylobacterium sp.]MDP3660684.1 toll/interleukin-1 receptor domain-containing protein [Phenylobacterium sp.]